MIVIRELKEENELLKKRLLSGGGSGDSEGFFKEYLSHHSFKFRNKKIDGRDCRTRTSHE